MQIKSIKIVNFRGIEELEIQPGALTVVSGANGKGKSSVLNALQSVFEGGHDETMVRIGTKKAEVELELTDGSQIKRTITPRSSTLTVTSADGNPVKAPATYVAGLAGGFAIDPVALILAKPKERGAYLLKTSNTLFQPAELAPILGQEFDTPLRLEGLEKVRKELYERRRDLNVRSKEQQESAYALKSSMPPDLDRDWIAEAAQVESDLFARSNEQARITAEATAQWAAFEHETRNELEAKIAVLTAERDAKILAERKEWEAQRNHDTAELSAEILALSERRTEAKTKADEQKRCVSLKAQIEVSTEKYRKLDAAADQITKALEKLETLKVKKLAAEGIEGIEIREGEIYVGGIPFDALNTAEQYRQAIQIVARGAGVLPFMLCDRAECFDPAAWKEFCEIAAESDMQIFAAKVDDGALTVGVQ